MSDKAASAISGSEDPHPRRGAIDDMVVTAVLVGTVRPLGSEGVPSAFRKDRVGSPVRVDLFGLAGDEQADPRVHGGPEKAVYGYATRNYAAWLRDFPEHSPDLIPGGFGENLTVDGVDEQDVCVGDVHRIGSAILQICQPRTPCYKLALRFDDNRLPRALMRSGRSGWYYRVLEGGELREGDRVSLLDRPHPDFPLGKVLTFISSGRASAEDIERMAGMPELASQLRTSAQTLLRRTLRATD